MTPMGSTMATSRPTPKEMTHRPRSRQLCPRPRRRKKPPPSHIADCISAIHTIRQETVKCAMWLSLLDGSAGLLLPCLELLGHGVETNVAVMPPLLNLPFLHGGTDGAALLLHMGTAHEAALSQVGHELSKAVGQPFLVQQLRDLRVKGGWCAGRAPAFC